VDKEVECHFLLAYIILFVDKLFLDNIIVQID